jgi:hypothetical protein
MDDQTTNTNQAVAPAEEPKKTKKTVLVAVSVLLLLCAVGYGVYAWQQSRIDSLNKQIETLQKEEVSTTNTKSDTKDWLVFTNAKDGYSLEIPDGWQLVHYTNTGYLTTLDTNSKTTTGIAYKPGTEAKVTEAQTQASANYLAEFSIASDNQIDKTNKNWAATKVGTVDLAVGSAEKHYYLPSQDQNIANDKTNQSVYVYYFTKNGKDIYVTYTRNVGTEDQSELVEKALKTLK